MIMMPVCLESSRAFVMYTSVMAIPLHHPNTEFVAFTVVCVKVFGPHAAHCYQLLHVGICTSNGCRLRRIAQIGMSAWQL